MCVIDLISYLEDETQLHWFPLKDPATPDNSWGEILLRFIVTDAMTPQKNSMKPGSNLLKVQIFGARCLPKADTFSSDPYAAIDIEKTRLRTDTVLKSLTPTWNKSFTVSLVLLQI
jgi:Ca2+-dependent lipid-binding protein